MLAPRELYVRVRTYIYSLFYGSILMYQVLIMICVLFVQVRIMPAAVAPLLRTVLLLGPLVRNSFDQPSTRTGLLAALLNTYLLRAVLDSTTVFFTVYSYTSSTSAVSVFSYSKQSRDPYVLVHSSKPSHSVVLPRIPYRCYFSWYPLHRYWIQRVSIYVLFL